MTEIVASAAQAFTAHNIGLPDGSQTLPGAPLLADGARCRAALRDLRLAFPGVPPEMTRVADLGCLEGGYSVAFARAGYDVTGIEARAENMACCRYVQERVALPNLEFVKADVRDVVASARLGEWSAVYCGGLLYHLDNPVAFLRELGRATARLLIVDTHYSVTPGAEHEGYRGHWYEEGQGRWSSWKNTRSFWLAKDDLLAAMHAAGFSLVFEQADSREDMLAPSPDRSMFAGIKVR